MEMPPKPGIHPGGGYNSTTHLTCNFNKFYYTIVRRLYNFKSDQNCM